MPKLLLHILSVFLIPCLLFDPSYAVAFSPNPLGMGSQDVYKRTLFTQQAITPVLREFVPSVLLRQGIDQRQNEAHESKRLSKVRVSGSERGAAPFRFILIFSGALMVLLLAHDLATSSATSSVMSWIHTTLPYKELTHDTAEAWKEFLATLKDLGIPVDQIHWNIPSGVLKEIQKWTAGLFVSGLVTLRFYSRLPFFQTAMKTIPLSEEEKWDGSVSPFELLYRNISKVLKWVFGLNIILLYAFISIGGFTVLLGAMTAVMYFALPAMFLGIAPKSVQRAGIDGIRVFLRILLFPFRYIVEAFRFTDSPALTLAQHDLLEKSEGTSRLLMTLADPLKNDESDMVSTLQHHPKKVDSLRHGLREKKAVYRLYSAWAIAFAGHPEDINRLIPLMSDDVNVARTAWESIKKLNPNDEQTKRAWRQALDSHDPDWVLEAGQRLGADEIAIAEMSDRLLSSDSPEARLRSLLALKQMNLAPIQWVAIWKNLLKAAPTAQARVAAVQELMRLDHQGIVDPVLRSLRDRSGAVRVAAQEAFTKWIDDGMFEEDVPHALGPTIKNLSHKQPRVRTAALQTLAALSHHGLLSAETLYTEIERAGTPLQERFFLYKLAPETFTGKPEERLLKAVNDDVLTQPEAVQNDLLAQEGLAIQGYLNAVHQAHHRPIPGEWDDIISLMSIVHDNLPLCLDSLRKMGLPISGVRDLIDALPINNPLTRILRMLGEESSMTSGYLDVTRNVTQLGFYPDLHKLILKIVLREQRSAPSQVEGLLELLRDYRKQLKTWIPNGRWSGFEESIEAYHQNGYPILTPTFFEYFRAHRSEPAALDRFKHDLDLELKNVEWGNFFGLSPEFKARYGLKNGDEIALLGRYLSLTNLAVGDFVGPFQNVKSALNKIGPDHWQSEVPRDLRQLYSLKGSRTTLVYTGNGDLDDPGLEKLGERLSGLASRHWAEPKLSELIETILEKPAEAEKSLIGYALNQQPQAVFDAFQHLPTDIGPRREWLSRWYTLLTDTIQTQYRKALEEKIALAISRDALDADALEKMLARLGFRWIDLQTQKTFPDPDQEILKAISEKDFVSAASLIKKKWWVVLPLSQLNDDKLFEGYVDRSWPKLLTRLQTRLPVPLSAEDQPKLRHAITEARRQYLVDQPAILSVRTQQLVRRLTDQWFAVTKTDIDAVSKELQNFKEIETNSEETLYVGYFDDLMHLAGEFMMTGVCTLRDRARQIQSGKSEGYHFGTLALKNESGRVIAFSQVQLLKIPLKGSAATGGYHVFCLTGINLSEKELPIERRKAVLALLKAADLLAKKTGIGTAAIVVNDNIHSNQHDVKAIVRSLVSGNMLRKASLAARVILSEDPEYEYRDVYVIEGIHEPVLQPVSIPVEELSHQPVVQPFQVLAQTERQEAINEEVPLLNDLGSVRAPAGLAEPIRQAVESILHEMPSVVFVEFRRYLKEYGIPLSIDVESALESRVESNPEAHVIVGEDVVSEMTIEPLGLAVHMAELVASFVVIGYDRLKADSFTNENAWFKLELIKALLNYQIQLPLYYKFIHRFNWSPETFWHNKTEWEQRGIAEKINDDLSIFTAGWTDIFQWNVFLSVMDDADPHFLVANYMHLLGRKTATEVQGNAEAVIYNVIEKIGDVDTTRQISIAHLRNIVKEFLLDDKIHREAEITPEEESRFKYFDDSVRLAEWHSTLNTTTDLGLFYKTLHEVMTYAIPLNEKAVSDEMRNLVTGNDPMRASDRSKAITEFLDTFLVRRIGSQAVTAFKQHLKAEREGDIPLIETIQYTLRDGEDADRAGAYRSGIDWLPNLFKLPGERSSHFPGAEEVFSVIPFIVMFTHPFVGVDILHYADLVLLGVTLYPIVLYLKRAVKKWDEDLQESFPKHLALESA